MANIGTSQMDLSQPLADYGIKPTGILFDKDNGGIVYFLLTIPRVDAHYLGVRQIGGDQVGKLIHRSELEKAANGYSGSSRIQHQTSEHSSILIDGEQPLNPETLKELVYIARGFHPPEQYDIDSHPFPNTLDSETSGL